MARTTKIKVFVGEARPCYDSAPLAEQEMTDSERRTLCDMIGRYLKKCRQRRAREADRENARFHARRVRAMQAVTKSAR